MKQKRPDYAKRHDRVIFQYNNGRSHVAKPIKETLEALNGISYPPYSLQMLFPITTYFDEWLMRLSSAFIIMKILKMGRFVNIQMCRFSDVESTYYQKDEKK